MTGIPLFHFLHNQVLVCMYNFLLAIINKMMFLIKFQTEKILLREPIYLHGKTQFLPSTSTNYTKIILLYVVCGQYVFVIFAENLQ